jgi:hypothetical protein
MDGYLAKPIRPELDEILDRYQGGAAARLHVQPSLVEGD